MSYSDELLGWSQFAAREAPALDELRSPAAEIAALLQRYRADVDSAQRATDEAKRAGLEALAEQSVFIAQLAAALDRYEADLAQAGLSRAHRHLRVLKDQMLSAVRRHGLEVVMPLGQPYEAVADRVEVDGWRHDTRFAAEVVAEVVEPIVLQAGKVLRQGRVVMGAPPAQDDQPENEFVNNPDKREE